MSEIKLTRDEMLSVISEVYDLADPAAWTDDQLLDMIYNASEFKRRIMLEKLSRINILKQYREGTM